MDLEADAVPRAVAEALAVAGILDHGARGGVHVAATVRTGADGGEAGELRREDEFVDGAHLVGRLTGRERARDVAAVAVNPRAGVDDDQLTGADDALAGQRVRLGAVVAGGDDRAEGLALRPQAVVLGLQVPRHVALRAADKAASGDEADGLVGHRPGPAHQRDLGLILHGTQQRHTLAHISEPALVHTAQASVGGVAQLSSLVPDPRILSQHPGDLVRTVGKQRLRGDLAQLEAGHFLVHLLPVAGVGAEQRSGVADHERGIVAAKARQVTDVDGVRDDEPIDAKLLEKAAAAVKACAHGWVLPAASFARAPSAST